MVRPIEFLDYDKITDLIYELGQKTILELVVSLSRKNETTLDRYHFHREFKYDSKYSSRKMISIKRSFDYYLLLSKSDIKESGVMIRVQDLYLVISRFQEALKWFETAGIFSIKAGTKDMYIKTKQQSILIPNLAAGKYIQLDPVVIVWENTGEQIQGIRLTLGHPSVFTDVPINKFYGLVYILTNLDIYGAAQNMVNYLQRPEYGTNIKEFENNSFLETPQEKDTMTENLKDNRQIPVRGKPRTYFDKIDELG